MSVPKNKSQSPLRTALAALAAFVFATQPAQAAVTEAWVQRYNNPMMKSLSYSAVAIAHDLAGNVIITGLVHRDWPDTDIVTIKYSGADGSVLWQRRYNGPDNLADEVKAIATDSSGNVIVAGYSGTLIHNEGYLASVIYTAKYAAADGALLWEHRYQGHPFGSDSATAVAVSGNGDVVVTGSSWTGETGNDYYTAKYAAADGALLWEKRYIGPADSDDPVAVAVDAIGNVTVAGSSSGGDASGSDYYTAKYAAADGSLLWEKRYSNAGYDSCRASSVDGNGNAVVTGFSEGNGNNYDYYTAKYAALTGALIWEQRYNGPANDYDWAYAIAVDGSGNVIVSGASVNASHYSDYYTAKYAAADGALLWQKRYDGPAHKNDQARALAVDINGNVVVTGASDNVNGKSDYYTAKYGAADGALLWEKRYNGPDNNYDSASAVLIDGNGDAVVTGTTLDRNNSADFYTAKYAATNGTILWERQMLGELNLPDQSEAVVVDRSGNVIVSGSSHNGTNLDFYTAKYARTNGALLWERRYNGPANSNDQAIAVAVDASGNVVVTGQSSTGINDDFYTAKYAALDGALLWQRRYNGPANARDIPAALAMDHSGNVIATGGSQNQHGESDFYTAKYAGADGALLWEQRFGGDDEYGGSAAAVAISSNGNVAVTGPYERSRSHFHTEVYAAADGAILWAKEYAGLDPLSDSNPHAIAFDHHGNVVVTGQSDGLNGESDYYTAKYAAADGALLWEQRHNGPLNNDDSSRAVAIDKDDNVFVTGAQDDDDIDTASYYTAKYAAADGSLLWERSHQSFSEEGDHAIAIAIDPAGNAIVTGASGYDAATIKYRGGDGTILWETRSSFVTSGRYNPSGFALGPHGIIAVTGVFSFFDATGSSHSDYATIVYRESISIERIFPGVRLRFTGTPGQTYNIERAPTITGPWSTNATLVAATNGIIEHVDTNAPPGSAFYRTRTP